MQPSSQSLTDSAYDVPRAIHVPPFPSHQVKVVQEYLNFFSELDLEG